VQPSQGFRRNVSFVRFEALCSATMGPAYYQKIKLALKQIAAQGPINDQVAMVMLAVDAFEKPPSGGIDPPLDDWKTNLNPQDITGEYFTLIETALVGAFPDIATKIDALMAAWPKE
jgi:hypothetical protein